MPPLMLIVVAVAPSEVVAPATPTTTTATRNTVPARDFAEADRQHPRLRQPGGRRCGLVFPVLRLFQKLAIRALSCESSKIPPFAFRLPNGAPTANYQSELDRRHNNGRNRGCVLFKQLTDAVVITGTISLAIVRTRASQNGALQKRLIIQQSREVICGGVLIAPERGWVFGLLPTTYRACAPIRAKLTVT
jgi:hypothetical protein